MNVQSLYLCGLEKIDQTMMHMQLCLCSSAGKRDPAVNVWSCYHVLGYHFHVCVASKLDVLGMEKVAWNMLIFCYVVI